MMRMHNHTEQAALVVIDALAFLSSRLLYWHTILILVDLLLEDRLINRVLN
jgi:hypothetical protein